MIVCFLLVFSHIGRAQKKIDKLQSDDDVVGFVKNFFLYGRDNPDPRWKTFQLVDGDEWQGLYNLSQQAEDSLAQLKVNKWQTIDFNLDKKTDLIVCGKLPHGATNQYVLIVFLSNDDGGYDEKSLVSDEYASYPYYFSLMLLPKVGVPGIRLVKWFPDINNQSRDGLPFSVDTLGFAKTYLVNYNGTPDSALFKKVRFESSNYNGNRTVVKIENLDKGTKAQFQVVTYRKANDSTSVKGKITMDIYAELLSLINYSGFKEMPDVYQSNTNWPQTYTLDVTYSDGSIKKLQDFSGGGRYSLSAIYSWFDWLIGYTDQSLEQRRYEQSQIPFDF
ncbi:MAG: hypothetical protein QM610_15440 [Chitinophagaceae bacterium]